MLLGALLAGLMCWLGGLVARRHVDPVRAWSVAALVWSVLVIALVTLVPAQGPPGLIPADEAQVRCSWDLGGPAPDGFWIFSGGQRLLNLLLFVPAGVFLALAVAGRRSWLLVLPGLALLAVYSAGIEYTQLELARLDRACDVTDIVDNVSGAALGVGIGLVLAATLGIGRHVVRRVQRDPTR